MIASLDIGRVLAIHDAVIASSGGAAGLRDRGAPESAAAQPEMSFGGEDLYPSLAEKAAALAFSLIANHPFVDGNKRVGFAAMDVFLRLNGYKIAGDVDEQERTILAAAAGTMDREAFAAGVETSIAPLGADEG